MVLNNYAVRAVVFIYLHYKKHHNSACFTSEARQVVGLSGVGNLLKIVLPV